MKEAGPFVVRPNLEKKTFQSVTEGLRGFPGSFRLSQRVPWVVGVFQGVAEASGSLRGSQGVPKWLQEVSEVRGSHGYFRGP